MTPEKETSAPLSPLVTENRAQRITKVLEKDPVFSKRLGQKTVEVPKRSGGSTFHYEATVAIITAMKASNVEVGEASRDQIIAFSCDYFGIPRPATLEDSEDDNTPLPPKNKPARTSTEPCAPFAEQPVAESEAPAPAPEKPEPTPDAPVEAAPSAAPVEAKEPEPIKPKKKVAAKPPEVKPVEHAIVDLKRPEAVPATGPKPDEAPRLSEATLEGPPGLVIYIVLLTCLQLAKLDKTKGAAERYEKLDRLTRDYGRSIGAK